MISRPLVLVLLAAGCVTAAAGGAYVAVRHNRADPAVLAAAPASQPTAPASVAETEAVVTPAGPAPTPVETPSPAPAAEPSAPAAAPRTVEAEPAASRPASRTEPRRPTESADPRPARRAPASQAHRESPSPAPADAAVAAREPVVAPLPPVATPVEREVPRAPEPAPAPPERELVDVIIPASSVIGLQVDTSLSSERARVEDRVEARVTRDVSADGRVAIPAGSRVLGAVTLVERGGKMKERARLGIRFHTVVLADGTEMPLRTESIFREGESPSGETARKVGGAAIGGAILGAILGGGKGAAVGGAVGAAGGTAAVMAGDRNAATLPAGTVVSVHLASPVTIAVDRD